MSGLARIPTGHRCGLSGEMDERDDAHDLGRVSFPGILTGVPPAQEFRGGNTKIALRGRRNSVFTAQWRPDGAITPANKYR